MERILIVDDEASILHSFRRILKDKGYDVFTAQNGEEAIIQATAADFNLIIMDINMPGVNGLEAFKKIKLAKPKIPIIMMTGFGSTEITIETMRMGAYDYVTKPFDVNEITSLIDRALAQSKLTQEISIAEEITDDQAVGVQKIIGNSPSMQNLYKLIGKVAGSNVPVLIQGESGTGKELFARALYSYSDRKDKPFLAVNCAAIPDTLLESELFGYEKGAFTGANERKIGRFEQCNSGTLFLDEIGDMPLMLQAKLLRVLQSGELERLGSNTTIKVDVRLISATNKNLEKAIADGSFREDLYYRLNVVTLNVPPLRDRAEDIPVLIDYFIQKFNKEFSKKNPQGPAKKIDRVHDKVKKMLLDYRWPGNVRELENVINRAVVLSKDNVIGEEDIILKDVGNSAAVASGSLQEVLDAYLDPMFKAVMKCEVIERYDILPRIEDILIKKSTEAFNNNQVQVARLLGITRNTLRKRLEQQKVL
ncbi:MAG: sigma-54 dependent transcriptional regulator [Candidatus Margulisiibacteriota bacterium]|jgi:DNA-binding NtrC family response regulator